MRKGAAKGRLSMAALAHGREASQPNNINKITVQNHRRRNGYAVEIAAKIAEVGARNVSRARAIQQPTNRKTKLKGQDTNE